MDIVTAVKLDSFERIASISGAFQKLTVTDEGVQTREANTSIKGRLVSWFRLYTSGDAQKALDQGAFRTALQNKYGETLGADAYARACRVCGIADGRSHSLTARQVIAGLNEAEYSLETSLSAALISKTELNYAVSPEKLQQKLESLEANAEVPEKRDVAPIPSTSYFTVPIDGRQRVTNEQILQSALSTLDAISERIEQKFGNDIADTTKKNILNSGKFQDIHQEISKEMKDNGKDPNSSAGLTRMITTFIEEIWFEAQYCYIESLPDHVREKFSNLNRDLSNFADKEASQSQLDEISVKYGLKEGSVRELSDRYSANSNKKILNIRREFAAAALGVAVDRVYSLPQNESGLAAVSEDTFKNVLGETRASFKKEEALLEQEHLEEVARETAALELEPSQSETPAKPITSILKSSQPSLEITPKKSVHWG